MSATGKKEKFMKRQGTVFINEDTPNCPPEMIAELRAALNDHLSKMTPEEVANSFEECDLEMMRTHDWYATRYLLRNDCNIKDTANMLIKTAKWRKEIGMAHWKDQDFPAEFYRVCLLFPYSKDRDGNTTVILRPFFKLPRGTFYQPFFNFTLHVFNRIDQQINGRGICLLYDCTRLGLNNADFALLWDLVTVLWSYNPKWLNTVYVYELGWALRSWWAVSKKLIPERYSKLVKMVNKKDIFDHFEPGCLPDFVEGGTCKINYRKAPSGCISIDELGAKLGATEKEIADVHKLLNPLLQEADEYEAKLAGGGVPDNNNIDVNANRRKSSLGDLWHFLKAHKLVSNAPAQTASS